MPRLVSDLAWKVKLVIVQHAILHTLLLHLNFSATSGCFLMSTTKPENKTQQYLHIAVCNKNKRLAYTICNTVNNTAGKIIILDTHSCTIFEDRVFKRPREE